MALFERNLSSSDDDDMLLFPTLPAFVLPVEVRDVPSLGAGHKGVFTLVDVAKGTKFWKWTRRVHQIHKDELEEYIQRTFLLQQSEKTADTTAGFSDAQVFLRQGFVLPDNDEYFCSNPTDAGRFMNHSSNANCGPDGTLRDIPKGEELTMNYEFHGNPEWYQAICARYGVLTERQVAEQYS